MCKQICTSATIEKQLSWTPSPLNTELRPNLNCKNTRCHCHHIRTNTCRLTESTPRHAMQLLPHCPLVFLFLPIEKRSSLLLGGKRTQHEGKEERRWWLFVEGGDGGQRRVKWWELKMQWRWGGWVWCSSNKRKRIKWSGMSSQNARRIHAHRY